ncbi:MAG: hypothetical protein LUI87_06720 [Lachnospiraceae bacterium]|nr:hypothetical protein [Lachnospiraceae bacterium]
MKKRQGEKEVCGKSDEKIPGEEKKRTENTKENPDDKSGVFLKTILASLCLVIAIMLMPYAQSVLPDDSDSIQTESLSEMVQDGAGAADEDENAVSSGGEAETERKTERETITETESKDEIESEAEMKSATDLKQETETESGNLSETAEETEIAAVSESTDASDPSDEPDTDQDDTRTGTASEEPTAQIEDSSQADVNGSGMQAQGQSPQTGSVSIQAEAQYNAASLSVTGIPNTLLNYIANRYELQYTLYDFLWKKGYRNNVSTSVSDYEIDPDARCATIYFILSDGSSVTGIYDLDANSYTYQ